MNKTKVKIPAKINLTLDIVGELNGYHLLNSLCASVNVYDTIILKKRNDKKITLIEKGIKCGASIENNNAYKAVKFYMKMFNTNGVDIVLKKDIPVGSGLGGSSVDIAGALIGMKKLFGFDDIKSLADMLGSDSGYMLTGGFATISGRGEIVKSIETSFSKKDRMPIIIFTVDKSVSAKQSYQEYDTQNVKYEPITKKAVEALKKKDRNNFYCLLKNDLFNASNKILPSIGENISILNDSGASIALMTGSGSAVYGIYDSQKNRNKAYKKLKKIYKHNIIKAETL